MRAFIASLPLRILSLALAVVLWFVIAGEKTSERGLSVPVELQNFPADLEITGDTANTVEVRLRGSPAMIERLGPSEVTVQLDLAAVTEGERIVHLTAEMIRMPFGVKVVRIKPAIVTLKLERTVQKLVPVRPRLVGRPRRGYRLADVTSEPAEVRIAGPRSRVQGVETAFTEPVSVDGSDSTVVTYVNIGIEDPLMRIQGSPRVRVTARIRDDQEKR